MRLVVVALSAVVAGVMALTPSHAVNTDHDKGAARFFIRSFSTRTWTFLSTLTSTRFYTCYNTGTNMPCMGRKLRRRRGIEPLNHGRGMDLEGSIGHAGSGGGIVSHGGEEDGLWGEKERITWDRTLMKTLQSAGLNEKNGGEDGVKADGKDKIWTEKDEKEKKGTNEEENGETEKRRTKVEQGEQEDHKEGATREAKFFFTHWRTSSTTVTVTSFSTNRSITMSVLMVCTYPGITYNLC